MSGSAHGLAGEAAARDWPRLSVAALAPVIARYSALGAVRDVAWHSRRPFAASGLVTCGNGAVFVKRHDPRVRDPGDLFEEHGFIAHLRARGAGVPRVLTDDAGASAVVADGGVYEIHALGEGEDCYREAHSWTPLRACDDARAAGAALARLHDASAGYDAPQRRTRLLVAGDFVTGARDPMAALEAWVAEDALLRAALHGRDWRGDFARVVQPWLVERDCAPACWVHGDFHASNLLWRAGAVSSVLDFGLCNRASAVFDLATAIERNAIAWLTMAGGNGDFGRPDLACALLEGYASVRALPDLGALRRLLPVVHVEFALSELAYFHGITRNARNADLAYGEFLLGHAAWFARGPGQRFLDALT